MRFCSKRRRIKESSNWLHRLEMMNSISLRDELILLAIWFWPWLAMSAFTRIINSTCRVRGNNASMPIWMILRSHFAFFCLIIPCRVRVVSRTFFFVYFSLPTAPAGGRESVPLTNCIREWIGIEKKLTRIDWWRASIRHVKCRRVSYSKWCHCWAGVKFLAR